MSSLLDELPPLPLDNLPQADFPAGVVPNYRPSRPKSWHKKKWPSPFVLKLGGGIVAVLIVGCLLVMGVSSLLVGGSGSSASEWSPYYYIPENAQLVAYANVDELRKSDIYADVRKLVDKQSPQAEDDFDVDGLSEVFLAGCGFGPNDEPLVVLRMKTDRSLKDTLPKARRQQPTKSFQGAEYLVLRGSHDGEERVFAKTGDRTFCLAPSEDMLKQAVERVEPQRAGEACREPPGGARCRRRQPSVRRRDQSEKPSNALYGRSVFWPRVRRVFGPNRGDPGPRRF